jgi:hypothetical protein
MRILLSLAVFAGESMQGRQWVITLRKAGPSRRICSARPEGAIDRDAELEVIRRAHAKQVEPVALPTLVAAADGASRQIGPNNL